jgi:hypothetical protein
MGFETPYIAALSECDIDAQQAEEEAQASGSIAHMSRVEVKMSGYAVQRKIILRRGDLPDLWALKMNV